MADSILNSVANFFYELLYYVGTFFTRILRTLYSLFRVFAGTEKVTFNQSDDYLVNIFFSNTTVTTIYGGMALIGFVLLLVFTILAVLKKIADLGDRMQMPLSEILRKTFTSFLFIISMNFIMLCTINLTNTLMQSIEYLFNNVYTISQGSSITFTDSQYATMARIFDTVGNYSLNSSASSRYNLNSCFNEIRPDMEVLESQKVFNFSYEQMVDGEPVESWQSVLSGIARAHDLSKDQPLDEYDIALSAAITNAMNYVRINDGNMNVLSSYTRDTARSNLLGTTNLDVILWLSASTDAAKTNAYNGDQAGFTDPVRGPYLYGNLSIYDLDQVESDFNLSFGAFSHLIVIIGGLILCKEFLGLVINCVARLFNMLLLYIMAPPFIATAPFDDGSKFRQWCVAFVIQSFSVFGSIISMRLLVLLIPVIFNQNLVILGGGYLGTIAKVLLIFGAAYTARKAGDMISGILGENAAMQSVHAGDVASSALQGGVGRIYQKTRGLASAGAGALLKKGLSLGGKAAKSILKSGFRTAPRSGGSAAGNRSREDGNGSAAGQSFRSAGGPLPVNRNPVEPNDAGHRRSGQGPVNHHEMNRPSEDGRRGDNDVAHTR